MSGAASPYHIYKRTQVTTASQGELILLAYEGALKWLASARTEMNKERPNLETVHEGLIKAQAILAELQGALRLDVGGEVADNLYQLYEFMQQQLVEANVRKDPAVMDRVASMLRELQEAWVRVVRGDAAIAASEGRSETPGDRGAPVQEERQAGEARRSPSPHAVASSPWRPRVPGMASIGQSLNVSG